MWFSGCHITLPPFHQLEKLLQSLMGMFKWYFLFNVPIRLRSNLTSFKQGNGRLTFYFSCNSRGDIFSKNLADPRFMKLWYLFHCFDSLCWGLVIVQSCLGSFVLFVLSHSSFWQVLTPTIMLSFYSEKFHCMKYVKLAFTLSYYINKFKLANFPSPFMI